MKRNELQAQVERTGNEASSKNLNLSKILLAIDNLYQRCIDGSYKMRYELDDHGTETKDRNDKNGENKEKKKKEMEFEEDDLTKKGICPY